MDHWKNVISGDGSIPAPPSPSLRIDQERIMELLKSEGPTKNNNPIPHLEECLGSLRMEMDNLNKQLAETK